MRIVGGRWRGLSLAAVGKGDEAARLRPTADRVRESIFNILASMGRLPEGAHVLDLFAGTGALGLEALSRGAASATFVERGRAAMTLLRANIERTGAEAKILSADATRLPRNRGERCGMVFLDPPYGRGLGECAMESAVSGDWLADDALLVWEEGSALDAPAGFRQIDRRTWGASTITFLEFR